LNRSVVFTFVAVVVAFALVWMPAPRHDYGEAGIAAVLAVLLVGFSFCWRVFPRATQLGVPIGYIAVASVLRDAAGGSVSGFGGLFLLPILWLAISGRRREVTVGLLAVATAQVVPLLWIGPPDYSASGWRGTIVQLSVAAIAGFTIQGLISDARRRTDESLQRAEHLDKVTRQLAEKNEGLLGLDRMKDEFVALVSHELRSPLTSIIGYLDLMIDSEAEPLSESQESFLGAVYRNADRLNSLVNDLLFLAKIDSGKLDLELAEINLGVLLSQAAESARPSAEAKDIALKVEADSDLLVHGDGGRLAQVVDNLVSNAIKFTPEHGQVNLRGAVEDGAVAVAVSDTGIGIPSDEIPLLFTRFFRASTATDNAIPGTGLGLAISQAIAEAHGGTIDVRSILGKGTTFQLRVPINNSSSLLNTSTLTQAVA
jgi:signal transduction histidine kinase